MEQRSTVPRKMGTKSNSTLHMDNAKGCLSLSCYILDMTRQSRMPVCLSTFK